MSLSSQDISLIIAAARKATHVRLDSQPIWRKIIKVDTPDRALHLADPLDPSEQVTSFISIEALDRPSRVLFCKMEPIVLDTAPSTGQGDTAPNAPAKAPTKKTFKIPGIGNHLFEFEVLLAYYFASAAHAAVKQKRNYTDEPYIVHPLGVLALLMEHCPDIVTKEVACAALLHDTTEDTGVTGSLILQLFGLRVESMVKRLSKATTTSFGNRTERLEVELRRLAAGTGDVQSIKVADLVHNYKGLKGITTGFEKTFFKEAEQLIEHMKDADPRIVAAWSALQA